MAAALAGNPSLDAAMARLRAARATLAESDAADRAAGGARRLAPAPAPERPLDHPAALCRLHPLDRQRAGGARLEPRSVRPAGGADRAGRLVAPRRRTRCRRRAAGAHRQRRRRLMSISPAPMRSPMSHAISSPRANSRCGSPTRASAPASPAISKRAPARRCSPRRGRRWSAPRPAATLAVHALAALAGRGADFYASVTRPQLRRSIGCAALPQALPADLLGRRPDLLAGAGADRGGARPAAPPRAPISIPNLDLRALDRPASVGIGSFFTADARHLWRRPGAAPAAVRRRPAARALCGRRRARRSRGRRL